MNCFACNKCHMKYTAYPNYVRITHPDLLHIYNQEEVTARDQKRQKMPENRHFATDVKIMPPESHLPISLIAEIMTLIPVIIQHRVESLMKEEEGMKTIGPMEKVNQ